MLKRSIQVERGHSGFSLVETLVALAIMTVLAAVLIPALSGKLKDSRTSTVSQTLSNLNYAVAEYKKSVGRYPGKLTLLTVNPTTSDRDLCGSLLSNSSTLLWRGPYLSREFVAAGIQVADGRVDADIRRFPTTVTSTPPTIAYALIDLPGIELGVAQDLDRDLDGTLDAANGAIRYTSSSIAAQVTGNPTDLIPAVASTSQVNLTYAIPVNPYSC
jgi:prepilin-type N-terminal cleavage/methylation domain-containing protein